MNESDTLQIADVEVIARVALILSAAGFDPMPEGILKGQFCISNKAGGYVFGGVHHGIGEVHAWDANLNPSTTNDPVEAAQRLADYAVAKLKSQQSTPTPEASGEPVHDRGAQTAPVTEDGVLGGSVPSGSTDPEWGAGGADSPVPEVDGQHTEAGAEGLASDEPLDADFEAIDQLGAQDELLSDSDFDTLALEGSDVETEAQDGPIAYGASTIDGLIREKLGRVSQIARELKAVQQEGWTVEEYAYLQNLMVRMDRGEAPDDQASRDRFLEIARKSQAMSRIDSVRDRKEGEMEDIGQRRDFDAAVYYEPSEGWP